MGSDDQQDVVGSGERTGNSVRSELQRDAGGLPAADNDTRTNDNVQHFHFDQFYNEYKHRRFVNYDDPCTDDDCIRADKLYVFFNINEHDIATLRRLHAEHGSDHGPVNNFNSTDDIGRSYYNRPDSIADDSCHLPGHSHRGTDDGHREMLSSSDG
jgi:hypothetical protein